MNNAIVGKALENMGKHRDTNLVTNEARRNFLVSEAKFHRTNFFPENLSATEIKKTQIFMNKPFCLGLSLLEISKIVMYKFYYDYVKPKYGEKDKLCYVNTLYSTVYIKTWDIHSDIAKDIETRLDTSNYELDRSLPKGKNKKSNSINERWIRCKNNDRVCRIATKNVYNYSTADNSENEKAKGTKKCVIKRKHKFENCLEAAQLENKTN